LIGKPTEAQSIFLARKGPKATSVYVQLSARLVIFVGYGKQSSESQSVSLTKVRWKQCPPPVCC
jgi:hypothetical protein